MTKYLLLIAAIVIAFAPALGQQSDAALRRVREQDAVSRDESGKLQKLSAAEHLSRAETYFSNRLFPEAREHWLKIFDNYPTDVGIPKALFGTARSYMWDKRYDKAVEWFEKLTKDYLNTKDGREGLAFKGASLVRLGKNLEAARVYEQYVTMFPTGERIESAHLNIIDAYREAGKYDEANRWVERTVQQFAGKPSEVSALHARLRMEIYREKWSSAVSTSEQLLSRKSFAGSMTSSDEVKYLRAFSLERLGKKSEAATAYASITPSDSPYFDGLSREKRSKMGVQTIADVSPRNYADYPIPFRTDLLREASKNKIDPRFLLAIMKQESSFRPNAKSPAGARGLLQLVFDTALKYNKKSGFMNLQPNDLYNPTTNIAISSVYIAELKDEFGGLYEAIAAGYNGGEDNAARWLNRSRPKEAGIFTSEIGFAETKDYVVKVMNNYRIYRELYSEDLRRK